MKHPVPDEVAAGFFAVAGFLVVLTPALAMQWGILHDGVGSLDDDILLASTLVGAFHALMTWRRVRGEERRSRRRMHVWTASLNSIVVLALSASLLVLVLLVAFPDENFSLGTRGAPVTLMWAGLQVVAVLLAEGTARLTFRYLEPPVRGEARRAAA